jgi:hypothetical protein
MKWKPRNDPPNKPGEKSEEEIRKYGRGQQIKKKLTYEDRLRKEELEAKAKKEKEEFDNTPEQIEYRRLEAERLEIARQPKKEQRVRVVNGRLEFFEE